MAGNKSIGLDFKQRLLGMKAVEGKFITEKQYTQCLNIIDFFEKDKNLTDILVEKGFMTQNQIRRLEKIIDGELDPNIEPRKISKEEASLFGSLALEKCLISEIQLEQALQEQEKYQQRGVRVQIGQILLKKGYVTSSQVSSILESQLNKTYYCKKCSITTTSSGAKNEIQQCTECGLDLVEMKKKKKPQKKTEDILPMLNTIEL
ncbi:hypothetical protein [Candidatus Uabimicrobium sp. HlEnr_7]|uniref:hypothetical protein n=1 Tax=Candidatus Uabimicrobium helgolandensis TaxID=3095367 RepID=UPI0035583A9E